MPQLVTVQEMASKLKVPVSWIYARTGRRSGDKIPHTRVGKYLRFKPQEVFQWIEDHQTERQDNQSQGLGHAK